PWAGGASSGPGAALAGAARGGAPRRSCRPGVSGGRVRRLPVATLPRPPAHVRRRAMKPALLLLFVGTLAGCGGAIPAHWIGQAAEAHAQADALVREGRLQEAARTLEELASRPAPAQVAAQDRRAVLQDTYARLADLALRQRNPEQALRAADAGLALGEGRDVF